MKRFHATNEPGTCLWCGHKLHKAKYLGGYGYCGENCFCTLTCGYLFAVDAAKNGYRFKPESDPPAKPPRRNASPLCPTCRRALKDVTSCVENTSRWECDNVECEIHREQQSFTWPDHSNRIAVAIV